MLDFYKPCCEILPHYFGNMAVILDPKFNQVILVFALVSQSVVRLSVFKYLRDCPFVFSNFETQVYQMGSIVIALVRLVGLQISERLLVSEIFKPTN